MRKHRELFNLDGSEMREEMKQRKRQTDDREKGEQLVVEIAQQEGLPLECCDASSSMNLYVKGTELEERLLHNNEIYKQTIKLGEEINTLLLEKGIEEGTLEIYTVRKHFISVWMVLSFVYDKSYFLKIYNNLHLVK